MRCMDVTMESSPEEKVRLFRAMFRGREDVYARRQVACRIDSATADLFVMAAVESGETKRLAVEIDGAVALALRVMAVRYDGRLLLLVPEDERRGTAAVHVDGVGRACGLHHGDEVLHVCAVGVSLLAPVDDERVEPALVGGKTEGGARRELGLAAFFPDKRRLAVLHDAARSVAGMRDGNGGDECVVQLVRDHGDVVGAPASKSIEDALKLSMRVWYNVYRK